MLFEWDPRKARANLRAHRVDFREARTVFGDPLAYTIEDPDHSIYKYRSLTFGESVLGRLLLVSTTERGGRIRIISAREATSHERKIYAEGWKDH
jgi:uncharacterized protein